MKLTVGQRKVWAGTCALAKTSLVGVAVVFCVGLIFLFLAAGIGGTLTTPLGVHHFPGFFPSLPVEIPRIESLAWVSRWMDTVVAFYWEWFFPLWVVWVAYLIWRVFFPSCQKCVDNLATKRGWVEEQRP